MTDLGRRIWRRSVPAPLRVWINRAFMRRYTPVVGHVRFGDLRRTVPIAPDFGYQRGAPVDRYFIEKFLSQNRADIRSRVLEVGDSSYTHQFGGDRVTQADVLHVDLDASHATFIGDLAGDSFLPENAFACIVLTQTLQLIYDFPKALRALDRALAPGGVLLLTVPGISNVDPDVWGSTWHYSFTRHSVERMCADSFPGYAATYSSFGNILAAVAFLHGLAQSELTVAELEDHHQEYSLIHAVRIVKPMSGVTSQELDDIAS